MINQVDRWLLARLLMGYPLPRETIKGMTELGQTISSQLGHVDYKDREILARRLLPAGTVAALLKADPPDDPPLPVPPEPPPFAFVRADDLFKLPPLSWLVPGEIVQGGLCVLYGESGVGKSFIALDYALRLASEGRKVVYAPTEGEGGYRKRVEAWKLFHQKMSVPDMYFLFGGVSFHDEKIMAQIAPRLNEIAPDLLVLDTLAMGMVGLDENSARDVGLFISSCRTLMRRLCCALLIVHHTSKSGVVERGSTAIRGNADTMIKISNADDLVLVECAKTKDEAPFQPRYLKLLEHAGSLIVVEADKVLVDSVTITPNQRKLLDVLALEVNADGLSLRDMAEATGLSTGAAQRAASNLLRAKRIQKGKSGYVLSKSVESVESRDLQAPAQIQPSRFTDSPDSPIQSKTPFPWPNLGVRQHWEV